jgi:WXG100 family type VII secretion target
MTGPMQTDAATLSAEAANFDRIAGELKTVNKGVESTGAELAGGWTGQAGTAAQDALVRYQEAARAQESQLIEISSNISQAGIQYTSADDEQAGSLSSQMNL